MQHLSSRYFFHTQIISQNVIYPFRQYPDSFSNFSWLSLKRRSCTFSIISGMLSHVCWSQNRSSSKISQLHLNEIIQLATVEYFGYEFPVFWKSACISFAFIQFLLSATSLLQSWFLPSSKINTQKEQYLGVCITVLHPEHCHRRCLLKKDD